MKIERLLAIIIYLLNHQRVSANTLADYYNVSKRTIQRDIDTLTLAGIPIISFTGSEGGYELMEEYKMHVQLADAHDYDFILTALKGFNTFLNSDEIQATLNKITSIQPKHQQALILDFSVLQEKEQINIYLKELEAYILEKAVITFQYTNASSIITMREVEPIAVIYQWYSWYLLAYDLIKQDYRYFKLIRMEKLSKTKGVNTHSDVDVNSIINEQIRKDEECYDIIIECKKGAHIKAIEYLDAHLDSENENGDYVLSMMMPKKEEAWKGTLLSFGKNIKIIQPQSLINELNERCVQFLKSHNNGDIL